MAFYSKKHIVSYLVTSAMVLAQTNSFAGDGQGQWRGGGQDQSQDGQSSNDSRDLHDSEEAALLVACGYSKGPSGNPFNRDGSVKANWIWGSSNKAFNAEFSANKSYSFASPLCEQYLLNRLVRMSSKGAVKKRCENIREELFLQNSELSRGTGSGGDLSFGDLSSLIDAKNSDSVSNDPCEDFSSDGENSFACNHKNYKDRLDDSGAQKQAARTILSACKRYGANMTPEMSMDQYSSYANGGVDAYGGYCGSRGGPVIIKNEHKWYDTVGNVVLGLAKVGLPTYAMMDANRRHENNARAAIDGNIALGFPNIVTAGGGVGGMYGQGGGGGCGAGCGGTGGYYGGLGGQFYGGAGYSGTGGGCPYGACYGNGGMVVGNGGYAGGAYGGGQCGTPPYAPWYGGCGAGGNSGSGFYGPGGYYGNFNGMGGGAGGGMGGPYGSYPYGTNGVYGPWSSGGMPGPYGTAGGGNGYGGPGNNGGYGNPYGNNGYQGQPGQYGAQQPFNAQQAQMQAQMYASYAAQMARQAQSQAQAAKLYQGTLTDLQKVQDKSYEAYYAYQMAQSGMAYPGMTGYGGASLGAGGVAGGGGGSYYGGYTPGALNSGSYYPPMSSGAANGGVSISGGFNYNSR